jgi:hypothetical protein
MQIIYLSAQHVCLFLAGKASKKSRLSLTQHRSARKARLVHLLIRETINFRFETAKLVTHGHPDHARSTAKQHF